MTKGKVVLVPFPFDDLSAAKVRPAVCLTEPIGPHRHLIVAFISSQVPTDPLRSDIVFQPHEPDFAATGLRTASALRLHRLMTLTTSLIRRELGELTAQRRVEVASKLVALFGLSSS